MSQILVVVVRYKTPIEASQTLASLAQAFSHSPALLPSFQVLLWDNSPEPLEGPKLAFPFLYRHSKVNAGLSWCL